MSDIPRRALIAEEYGPEIAPERSLWERAVLNANRMFLAGRGALKVAADIPKGLVTLPGHAVNLLGLSGEDLLDAAKATATKDPKAKAEAMSRIEQRRADSLNAVTNNSYAGYQDKLKQLQWLEGKPTDYAYDATVSQHARAAGEALLKDLTGYNKAKEAWTGTATTGWQPSQIEWLDKSGKKWKTNTVVPTTQILSDEDRGKSGAIGALSALPIIGVAGRVLGGSVAARNVAYRNYAKDTAKDFVTIADLERGSLNPTQRHQYITDPIAAAENILNTNNVPQGPTLSRLIDHSKDPNYTPDIDVRYGVSNVDPNNLIAKHLAQRGELKALTEELTRESLWAEAWKVGQKLGLSKSETQARYIESGRLSPHIVEYYSNMFGSSRADVIQALGRGVRLNAEMGGQLVEAFSSSGWAIADAWNNVLKNPKSRSAYKRLQELTTTSDRGVVSTSTWSKMAKTLQNLNLRSIMLPVTSLKTAGRNIQTQGLNSIVHSLDNAFATVLEKTVNSRDLPNMPTQSYAQTALLGLESVVDFFKGGFDHTTKRNQLLDQYESIISTVPRMRGSLNGNDVFEVVHRELFDTAARIAEPRVWTPEAKIANKAAWEQLKEDFGEHPFYTITDNYARIASIFNRTQEASFQNVFFRQRFTDNIKRIGYMDELASSLPAFQQQLLALSDDRAVRAKHLQRSINNGADEATIKIAKEQYEIVDREYMKHTEAMADAYLNAKKQTFALEPGPGMFGASILPALRHPVLTAFVQPYPRFMINQLTWLMEHNPVNFLDFFSPELRAQLHSPDYILRREATQAFGRALTGSLMIGAAYAIHDGAASKYGVSPGPTYNTLLGPQNPDGTRELFDLSAYTPFDSISLIGKAIHSLDKGVPSNIKASDLLEAIVNVRRSADIPIGNLGLIIRELESNPDLNISDLKQLGKLVSGWGSRFMVPFDFGRQLDGSIRHLSAVASSDDFVPEDKDLVKTTQDNPWAGPMLKPLAVGRPKVSPWSGRTISSTNPARETVTGVKTTVATPMEMYVQELGLNSHQLLPKFSNEEANNEFATDFGALINQQRTVNGVNSSVGKLLVDRIKSISRGNLEYQKMIVTELLRELTDEALEKAKARNPAAFVEDEAKRNPDLLREQKERVVNQLDFLTGKRH